MARIKMVDFPALKLEKPEVVKHSLSRYEQETIINFNKEERIAYIFTYEITWQKHLEKKLGLKPTFDNGWGGKGYAIDKSRIKPPRARKVMSAEDKKKGAERLARHRVLAQNSQ